MPTPPYARLLVSRNGGAHQTGGITAAAGDAVQLSSESTLQQTTYYEITDYPPGWPTPSGWTLDASSGIIFFVGLTPPAFTLPATSAYWGKWLFRLTVQEGIGELGAPDPTRVDTSTALKTIPASGLNDIAFGEDAQFSRDWIAELKATLRTIDTALTTGGTANATAIQSNPVDATAPTLKGSTVAFDPVSGKYFQRQLKANEIAAAFAPTSTISAGGNGPKDLGDTWSPTFTTDPLANAGGVTVFLAKDTDGGSVARSGAGPYAPPSAPYSKTTKQTVGVYAAIAQNGDAANTNQQQCFFGPRWWWGVGSVGPVASAVISAANGTITLKDGSSATIAVLTQGGILNTPVGQTLSPAPTAQKVWVAVEHGTMTKLTDANNDSIPLATVVNLPAVVSTFGSGSITLNIDVFESGNLLTTLANPLKVG